MCVISYLLSFAQFFLLILCGVSEQGYGFFADYFCSGIKTFLKVKRYDLPIHC